MRDSEQGKQSELSFESMHVTSDLRCAGCGYNLRTLDYDSRCPECGAPVADTLATIGAINESGRFVHCIAILNAGLAALICGLVLLLRTGLVRDREGFRIAMGSALGLVPFLALTGLATLFVFPTQIKQARANRRTVRCILLTFASLAFSVVAVWLVWRMVFDIAASV